VSRYKSVTGEKVYLRKFAGGYVVQVPAPGNGLGQRLNHMLDFCRDRFGADHTLWGAFGSCSTSSTGGLPSSSASNTQT
jgi:hypothetical protein